MAHDKDNLNEEPDFSFNRKEEYPFGIPSDYFRSFEDKLKLRLEAENELDAFPILSSIPKDRIFEVPAGYFPETENLLEYKTELADYPVLGAIEKPLSVPLEEEYISRLSGSLSYKLNLSDELKPYEILHGLDKVNNFAVSGDYFDTLADRVKARFHSEKTVRVSLFDKLWNIVFGGRTAWAFGLAFIVGLAFWFSGKTKIAEESADCKTLACLERDEILNNKAMTSFDEEQLIELVDINSLKKQLNLDKPVQDSLSNRNSALEGISDDDLLDAL